MPRLTNTRPASYGESGTVQDVADRNTEALIQSAIGLAAVDSYACTELRAVEFILEGGGPGADVTILLDSDGDVVRGYYTYYQPIGTATAPLGQPEAQVIYDALKEG